MKISSDKQGLFDDLNQRYQYLLDSAYPDDIVSFEEETAICSDDFYMFFSLVAGSLSYVIDHKRIPKKQLNVLRQSFEEQYPQIKSFQHVLESYPLLHSYVQYHEETRKRIIAFIQ
ncbi:YxiJ-like family protein [Bacillus safensis]|uniref:YxiJ-like family protein n=1 Tax=Bacillus safensis TaxID=561879 RepID=UPI0020BEC004|nr:YxiJ-like family protein [Bacillus safensis]MCK8452107.1 YxiJ-like family protein [Bacillus safensis]